MFGFLKDKLKSVISKISKKVEEEAPKEEIKEVKEKPKKEEKKLDKPKKEKQKKAKKLAEEKLLEEKDIKLIEEEIVPEKVQEQKTEEQEQKKGFFVKIKEKFTKKEEVEELEIKEEVKPKEEKEQEEKKGFFGIIKEKITTTKISEDKFEELFYDLELALLENNVAFEVIQKIKEDLKKDIVEKPIKKGEVENTIKNSLKESIADLFLVPKIDLIDMIKNKKEKPFVICFFGVNGVGKTTTIAKIAKLCQNNNLSVVLGAGDSFRKGSIEQLEEWGKRLGIKVIKHQYGADPTAICFDAVSYGKSHNINVVLLDTAGRQHSNKDLMQELNKIKRVIKPDLNIFIAESLVGNDAIEQAQIFNEKIGIDAIILTKADVDEKGGTVVSISYVIHRPILYMGVGQRLQDLKEFNKEEVLRGLDF